MPNPLLLSFERLIGTIPSAKLRGGGAQFISHRFNAAPVPC
jgi:hypothetical protein